MSILLINPPMNHIVKSTISDFVDSILTDNPLPPLGILYIASHMKQGGSEVKVLDMVADKESNLEAVLRLYKPDMIGITATTLSFLDALTVAKKCKEILPSNCLVIGGPHCSIYPQETEEFECFDYVVRGEGEFAMSFILDGEESDVICELEPFHDLDVFPFPARELTDITKYHSALSKKLVTTMITSRGCPYNCLFCYQPHFGKKWRARSAQNIFEEMVEIKKMGIDEIEIYDDTFTYDINRVIELCGLILSHELKIDWNIRTRVDKVDIELLKIMKRAGCGRINYGIESANPEVLKTLRKGFHIEQAIDAIKWTKQAGISVQAYFMLGSPNETQEQMMNTINFANKSGADYCYYSLTAPFPCTDLYKRGIKEKKYNDYWLEYAKNPTDDFTMRIWDDENKDEMVKLYKHAQRSFYGRPEYIIKELCKVRSMKEFTDKAKIAIGMFK